MILFPKELLLLIYSSRKHWELLALTGVTVLIIPYMQTVTAMLQTLGKVWTPIWITVGAVLLKFILNTFFINMYGVEGAVVSTILAFGIAVAINTVLLQKVAPLSGSGKILGKLALCAIFSCGGAKVLHTMTGGTLMLLVSVALAAAVYFILIIKTRCITKEEFKRG